MRSREIEKYKQSLKLTSDQRELLIGLLLGDAHLETANSGRTYRLKIEHSKSQERYVNWIYSQLKEWVRTAPQKKEKHLNGKVSENVWFQTYSHPAFKFYAQQFYQENRKKVPKLISRWLTPKAMGVWFMDDGSYKSKEHRALILNTQGFARSDILLLQNALERIHSVKTQIRKQKDGMQILIVEPNASRFASIIRPYLREELTYKLGKIGLTQLPKE